MLDSSDPPPTGDVSARKCPSEGLLRVSQPAGTRKRPGAPLKKIQAERQRGARASLGHHRPCRPDRRTVWAPDEGIVLTNENLGLQASRWDLKAISQSDDIVRFYQKP